MIKKFNEMKNDNGLISDLTVGELIEELKKFDPEEEIIFNYNGDSAFPATDKEGSFLGHGNYGRRKILTMYFGYW